MIITIAALNRYTLSSLAARQDFFDVTLSAKA
jgi:hypothetical protein